MINFEDQVLGAALPTIVLTRFIEFIDFFLSEELDLLLLEEFCRLCWVVLELTVMLCVFGFLLDVAVAEWETIVFCRICVESLDLLYQHVRVYIFRVLDNYLSLYRDMSRQLLPVIL